MGWCRRGWRARAGGRRSSRPGARSRSRPPSDRSSAARASARCCVPPRTNGQPETCAVIARTSPNEAVATRSRATIEWAQRPAEERARRARHGSAAGRAARPARGRGARSEPPPADGAVPGGSGRGRRAGSRRHRARVGQATAGTPGRPHPSPARGRGDRPLEQGDPTVVQRMGQRNRRVDQTRRRAGRGRARGRTATRPMCPAPSSRRRGRSPGSVSSALRIPPPTVSAPS